MTRFKNALLDELVAYTQRPEESARPERSRRRRVVRLGSLAGAGVAAAVAAFAVVPTGQEAAAYEVDNNPDGTVTVTFRELGHAVEATRDLRAAGVPAQVVRLAAPGSCATTPGGAPLKPRRGSAYNVGMPSTYPFDGDLKEWLPEASATSLTINPAGIPDGAVLFVIEHSSPETGSGPMIEAGLVNKPAPTCWEATNYMIFPPAGVPTATPVTSSPTR
jgi:hypothetical protein